MAALMIGAVELAQVAGELFQLKGSFWNWVQQIDLNWMGYGLIILFITIWAVAYLIWKFLHIDHRWSKAI